MVIPEHCWKPHSIKPSKLVSQLPSWDEHCPRLASYRIEKLLAANPCLVILLAAPVAPALQIRRMAPTLCCGAQEASHELANLVQGAAEGPDLRSIFGATAPRAVSNCRNVILQFTEAP